jgi:hypothetical protein
LISIKWWIFSNYNLRESKYNYLDCKKSFTLGGHICNVKPKNLTYTSNVLAIIPKVNTSKTSISKWVEDEDKNDEDENANKVNFRYCMDDKDKSNDNIDQDWEDEDSDDEDSKDEDSEDEDCEDEDNEESSSNKSKDEKFDDNSNYKDGVKKTTDEEKKYANEKRGKNHSFVEHVDPTSVVGMNLLKDLENQIQSYFLK